MVNDTNLWLSRTTRFDEDAWHVVTQAIGRSKQQDTFQRENAPALGSDLPPMVGVNSHQISTQGN